MFGRQSARNTSARNGEGHIPIGCGATRELASAGAGLHLVASCPGLPPASRPLSPTGAVLTTVGVALGAGLALALTRFLRGLLFEVSPTDPLALAAAVGVLGGVALLASYLPARRATRLDPMTAIRTE
jgi:hypothetical protein